MSQITEPPTAQRAGDDQSPARVRRGAMRVREARFGLSLVSPTVLVVLLVVVFPFLWTIIIAFQELRLVDLQNVFNINLTLDNFRTVLGSPDLWEMVQTTLIYSIGGTVLSVGIGLVTALALQKAFVGRWFVRAVVLIPYVLPVVSAVMVWKTLLDPQFGPLNVFGMDVLGWNDPVAFLTERNHTFNILGISITVPIALLTVIVFEAWKTFPLAFLFILARVQTLPKDLDEAARVDGATPLQRFRYITLPQLSGVIALLVLLRFIWTFQNFNDVYLLTGGAAGTEVIAVQVFNYLTGRSDVGSSAALGMLMSVVLIAAFAIYYRFGVMRQERAEA